MDDNKFPWGIEFPQNILDNSYSANYVNNYFSKIEEAERKRKEMLDIVSESKRLKDQAILDTAENTAEANVKLQRIIDQQNDYIDLLKNLLSIQNEQLDILQGIFSADADSNAIEQEIEDIIRSQVDSDHPIRKFLVDKGGDVAVAGATAGITVLYNAFKLFLMSKGISI